LVIPGFNIRKTLTSNQDYVEFTPTKSGTYNFACSMGMGKGKIVVN
jgi:plastocyanin domain-containing protein